MRSLVTGSVLAIAVLLAGGMARAQGIYWESTTTIKAGGETTMRESAWRLFIGTGVGDAHRPCSSSF